MSIKLNQRSIHAVSVFSLSYLLFACAGSDELDKSYMDAPTIKPIVIPEGLVEPKYKASLVIPQEDVADNGIIPEKLQIPPPLENIIELDLDEDSEPKKTEQTAAKFVYKKLQSQMFRSNDGVEVLKVTAPIDDVWAMLNKAFVYFGYKIDDANRGRLILSLSREYRKFVEKDDPTKFEIDKSAPREKYLLYLVEKDSNVEVSLRNEAGKIDGSALAVQLLGQLKNYLQDPVKLPEGAVFAP